MSSKHLSYPKGYSNILTGNLPNGTYLEWSKIDNAIKNAYYTSGTATTNTANKLVDTGASFNSTVSVGDVVKNTTDDKYAFVVTVDSDTSLTLDWDCFPDGNEGYQIYSYSIPNGWVDVTEGDQYISDSDSEYNGMTIKQKLPENTLLYETDWATGVDSEHNVTHNLNQKISDLNIQLFIAIDTDGTNAVEIDSFSDAYSTFMRGVYLRQIDYNSFRIESGTNGWSYNIISNPGGVSWSSGSYDYWKIVVSGRTYGNILLFKYKETIATAQELRVNNLVVNETYTSRVALPVGTILPWSGESAPSGFLPCDGRAISRTSYPDLNTLYEIGGYKWGSGDGASTFNIPDFENLTLAEDPGVANTIRVGPNEWRFEEGSLLNPSASFASATTITMSELPSNTVAIHFAYRIKNDGSSIYFWTKKNAAADAGDRLFPHYRFADGGVNYAWFDYWIPTDGNSFYIDGVSGGNTYVGGIVGFKTSNENTTDPLGTYIVKVSNTSFEATVDATDIDTRLTDLEQAVLADDAYDTGWVTPSSWTNQEFTITHNLNCDWTELHIDLYFYDTSTSIYQKIDFQTDNTSTAQYGTSVMPIDDNSFKIQTGAAGVGFLNASGALQVAISGDQYRVIVRKPRALSIYKAKRQILGSYKYETNWTANSDWTNAEFLITHNLNSNLSDLIVKAFISTDGTEANSYNIDVGTAYTGSTPYGFTAYYVSTNQIKLQTATNGLIIIQDDGTALAVNSQSYYYKVVVYKPDLVSTIADNAETRLTNIETFLNAGMPNVANTVRVGMNEWQFTADNELDYTTTFSTTGTKTITELPTNTVAIKAWIRLTTTGTTIVKAAFKRNTSDTEQFIVQNSESTASDRGFRVFVEIPTDGNSLHLQTLTETMQMFKVVGFKTQSASFTPTIPSQEVNKVFHIEDQKTDNTPGGTATSGSWQTRDLNTSVINEIPGASLNSNQFVLPSGTYDIQASAPAYYVNRHQIRLRNITDSTNTVIGSSEFAGASTGPASTRSFLQKRFTITSSKTFEIQHQVAITSNTRGFGVESGGSFTVDHETYTQVWIRQVAV